MALVLVLLAVPSVLGTPPSLADLTHPSRHALRLDTSGPVWSNSTSQKSVRRHLQVARETAQDRGGHVLCRLNPKALSASELSQLEEGANVLRAGGGGPGPLQDPPRTDRRKD